MNRLKTKRPYLLAIDWALSLEIRVVETWVTGFSMLVGLVFASMSDTIKVLSIGDRYIVSPWSWKLYGGTLVLAACINFIGLGLSLMHLYKASRILRWLGSVLAATVWGACWLIPPTTGFNAQMWGSVYELLFFQRIWIAMSLVYRGTTRGINP